MAFIASPMSLISYTIGGVKKIVPISKHKKHESGGSKELEHHEHGLIIQGWANILIGGPYHFVHTVLGARKRINLHFKFE